MDSPTSDVLLSGSSAGADTTGTRAPGRRFSLVLFPDGAEWRQGRRRERWALPDHAIARESARATLTRVVRAVIGAEGAESSRTALVLVGADDAVLACIAFGPSSDIDTRWPDTSFSALSAHGVTLHSTAFTDLASVRNAYPGALRGAAALKARWARRRTP